MYIYMCVHVLVQEYQQCFYQDVICCQNCLAHIFLQLAVLNCKAEPLHVLPVDLAHYQYQHCISQQMKPSLTEHETQPDFKSTMYNV